MRGTPMNITVYGLIAVTCGLFPVLTGCVQAPPPASRTEAWIPPAGQAADPVWRDLRAGLPDLSRPLSLFSLTDLALENNPATARAWHQARAASEQVRYAEGYFMPSVTAGAGLTRQTTAAHPDSFDANTLSYGPGLQLSYLVCNFGGGRNAAVEQALQTVYAANFAFNQAIQDTLLNVQTAYYGVISARALAEAAQTNSLDAKAILEAASDRRDAGLGVDLDVLQAQTSYDQSRYALVAAEGQVKSAEGLLAQALHLPADTGIRVIPPATALPESLSGQDLRRLTDEALARRPDLASARAMLAAREAALRVAQASRWPSLYLNGSVTRNYYELYGLANRAAAANDWAYTGGVSLKWNLFDGYQTLSSVRIAEAQAHALREQLRQAELAASTEIWIRFQTYETALRKHEFSTMALKSATASREMALESYASGVKTLLDLLSAETQLAQARSQQVAVRQEIFTALAYLTHATGLIEKGSNPLKDIKNK